MVHIDNIVNANINIHEIRYYYWHQYNIIYKQFHAFICCHEFRYNKNIKQTKNVYIYTHLHTHICQYKRRRRYFIIYLVCISYHNYDFKPLELETNIDFSICEREYVIKYIWRLA